MLKYSVSLNADETARVWIDKEDTDCGYVATLWNMEDDLDLATWRAALFCEAQEMYDMLEAVATCVDVLPEDHTLMAACKSFMIDYNALSGRLQGVRDKMTARYDNS